MASWVARLSPDPVVWVPALVAPAGHILLCSWVRNFTLQCLSPPRCINGNLGTVKLNNAGSNPAMD